VLSGATRATLGGSGLRVGSGVAAGSMMRGVGSRAGCRHNCGAGADAGFSAAGVGIAAGGLGCCGAGTGSLAGAIF
jgi:hypothetical protein